MTDHIPPGTKPRGNSKEYLPCPFCGDRDIRSRHIGHPTAGGWVIECGSCPCELSMFSSEREAWERWNKRPAPETSDGPLLSECVTAGGSKKFELEQPASETSVSAPAAERVPLRYGKPFTGIHRGISRGGFHCTDNDCSCHLYQYPRGELKANACQCDPNPSIGGSPPCPVHDGESEDDSHV